MNRPVPISVFSDQHRTKSTTRSRSSCGTHTLVRAPQDFFLRRCARPSIRPTPRLWSGSSSPGTRSVAVRLDGPGGSCQRRPQRHSRRTLFANDRIPLAAVPVHHTDRKPALYPTSAASGWPPSLLRCSVFALFSCVLSVILTEERLLQFQLRQDTMPWRLPFGRDDKLQYSVQILTYLLRIDGDAEVLRNLAEPFVPRCRAFIKKLMQKARP